MTFDRLNHVFDEAGQGHVFNFFDELTGEQKDNLLTQLSQIDPARCNRIFQKAVSTPAVDPLKTKLEPLPKVSFDSLISSTSPAQIQKWREKGMSLIAENKVGVILLAGGQGTRLGSSRPKGCYDIGLPSHKSLFQLQAERIARLQVVSAKYRTAPGQVVIPWYVMTSGPTRKETESFFIENKYFGLDSKNVIFFEQGVLPAFSNDGKILMDEKHSIAVAPDGNGGIYAALKTQRVLEDLEQRKIPYVHTYCVDNCLVKVADPVFIGYCVEKQVECGAKSVPKRSPDEPVGVICLKDSKFSVVEYSEIDKATSELKSEDGSLVFRAGNIANHFYTVEFLKRIQNFEHELQYHIAKKSIKHLDTKTGERVVPQAPNGIKLELFIFDVFPFTNQLAVLETLRSEEFSPLKNAAGSPKGDSPDTSRADILAQHSRFARNAGALLSGDELEISPLVSYEGEGLDALQGVKIQTPFLLNSLSDLKQ